MDLYTEVMNEIDNNCYDYENPAERIDALVDLLIQMGVIDENSLNKLKAMRKFKD